MGDPITEAEDILDLSEEDFAKLPEPTEDDFTDPPEGEGDEGDDDGEGEGTTTTTTDDDDDDPNKDGEGEGTTEGDPAGGEDTGEGEGSTEGEGEADPNKDEGEGEGEGDPDKDKDAEEGAVDYEAEYKKLMAPFTANGKTITPKSPADILQLAQMGANYHKKMSGMAPARKALKILEKNGLLEKGQLDHLIDISKGDPDAINKLLRDKKINPLDVDVEKELEYTPEAHGVEDAELQLDEVLADISESPSYEKTLNVITKDWDDASRNIAAADPEVIRRINNHMDNGVYDKVIETVDYERSLGHHQGMTDLDAYKLVGNRLETEGAFRPAADPAQGTEQEKVLKPKTDPAKEKQRQDKKRKAAATGTSGKVDKLPSDFNPLDLSDDDFEKFDPKLLGIKI